jgi:thioredoxin 1
LEELMVELNEKDFAEKVEQSQRPVLLDFSAVWCPPCVKLKPVIERIALEFQDKLDVFGIDVDENAFLSQRFNIVSVPTMIFFRGGKEVKKIIGLKDFDTLKREVEAVI